MDFDLEVDHRKRRRNRTTQSCLNCHTSKRKCDRKRPCQRCIQLGLTGLCVYEVDDPALRDDPNVDENTRLRNRIAELESLVRELRGKPHPRWAEPNFCDGDATEKWHSRSSKRVQSQYQKHRREGLSDGGHHSEDLASHMPSIVKTEQIPDLSQHQLYRLPSSSGSALSNDTQMVSQVFFRGQHHQTGHHGFPSPTEESSVCYSSSSSPVGYGHRHLNDSGISNGEQYPRQAHMRPLANESAVVQHSCSCLTNPGAAHSLISFTHQLRGTMSFLRQLPEHNPHHQCLIMRRIMELDDIMHGNDSGYVAESSYETITRTESDIMSPASTSSHSSLETSIHDWPAMATSSSYDAYFPASSGDHNGYHKTYHIH
ncbi:hypothetical protein AcV7_009852 [Taiwanofungus camphoratus]|nr:hypothetical protein AcV7_009852 [Antrodia cinnamomea]